jgi:uncharacterized membrane protein
LHIQPNRVIRALVYNYRFVCLTICLHLFCHLLSFPSSLSGTTIIYCLYFYSFSIHFHDHLATILNVTDRFLYRLTIIVFYFLFVFCRDKVDNLDNLSLVLFTCYLVLFTWSFFTLFQRAVPPEVG